jgi:acetolactate synthase I/II/III large subunit
MSIKLSDYVMNFIVEQGVKHVFMLPGGGAMHLDDSVGRNPGLEYVCCLHEQACSIAAEAYSRVTGGLGVALVTTGPGGTNAITGLAGAWLESTPCLFLSGQVKRDDMKKDLGVRQLGPQELDIVTVVQSITKYAVTVTDPAAIRYHLEKAVSLATSGRKGPVWIDIPLDVQAAQIEPSELGGYEAPPTTFDAGVVHGFAAMTIAMLNAAERPVLLVGNGIRLSGGSEALLKVVEQLGIPVLATWMGADLMYDGHPLFFGKPGTMAPRGANFTIQNADFLLCIGARLDLAVTGFDQSKFARSARKIVVDVDPSELGKLRMHVDLPIHLDAREFLNGLIAEVPGPARRDRTPWLEQCRQWKDRYPVVVPEWRLPSVFVNSFVLSEVLAEESSEGDLLVPGSSGAGIDTFWMAYRNKCSQRVFSTGGLGAMGFGVPAALGACLAGNRQRTITVDGDGGFQMNLQELATVARLGLPIKFFVLNNQGYGSIRSMQRNHFKGHLVACDASSGLGLPDTLRLAEAYGIATHRITRQERLREQVREVLDSVGPMVCEVMIDPDQMVAPRVSSVVRPDGSMASRPLEDLWPFLNREEFKANMLIPVLDD